MERYVIATNNAHKLREIRAILENDSRAFLSMEEAHIHTDPEETGATFEANAAISIRSFLKFSSGFSLFKMFFLISETASATESKMSFSL